MPIIDCPMSRRLNAMRRPIPQAVALATPRPRPVEQLLQPLSDGDDPRIRYTVQPFKPGTSWLYVNGVRYWVDDDYVELPEGTGFYMPDLQADDEIYFIARKA